MTRCATASYAGLFVCRERARNSSCSVATCPKLGTGGDGEEEEEEEEEEEDDDDDDNDDVVVV